MKKYIYLTIIVILIIVCVLLNRNTYDLGKKIVILTDEPIENDIELINLNVKEVSNKYEEFNKIIKEANISIPLEDGFIPQGITLLDNYMLITGYYENGNNSICYVLDRRGNIYNIVDLNIKSHVGSIAYDSINNLVWVPDTEGKLNAYDVQDILTNNYVDYKYQFTNISDSLIDYLDNTKNSISYLTIYDNYIYIGNFSLKDKGLVKKYKINNSNGIKLEYISSFYVPSKTQGITFVEYNNKKYLITSNSYGRNKLSRLNIYEYSNKINDYSIITNNKYIDLPPMSEQIQVVDDDLYVIFESGAVKYYNGLDRVSFICLINIKEYMNNN